jgi:hypothetical protein
MQQDDERRRVEEQKRQKVQFQKEQEERRQYALEEAERLRLEADQVEERRRMEAEKVKSPFQKQQEYWAERKRTAARTSQPNSPAISTPTQRSPTQRSPTQARSPPRSPAVDQQRLRAEAEARAAIAEERRIQEIAARMQAEDEAAEAEATKQEELRKAEEKIRAAFAGMALERGEAPPPIVPMKESPARTVGKGGPLPGLGRSATFQSDGPAVPIKEGPGRIIGMKQPLPIKRAGTVAGGEAPANLLALGGGMRSNTAPISSNDGVPAVTRGNTVVGRPGGLPSGPRAGRGGLPSGPRPRRI